MLIKFIDEKGRIFGVINLIDLLCITLLVMVIAGVVWSRTNHDKSSQTSSDEYLWIKIDLLNENTPKTVLEYLESLQNLKDKDKNVYAKILKIESKPTSLTHIVSPDNLYLFPVNPDNMEVVASLELMVKKETNGFSFTGEHLRIGKKLTFNLGLCSFEGVITTIHDDKKNNG